MSYNEIQEVEKKSLLTTCDHTEDTMCDEGSQGRYELIWGIASQKCASKNRIENIAYW